MGINNNTTELSEGTIGTRNFDDYNAKEISTEISRHNYRKGIKSDRDLQDFREVVYKMVQRWAHEDKIAMLTEYGDANLLEKYRNPSEDVLSKLLTESIIIHLDPEDLRKLRSDMMRRKAGIESGIKRNNERASNKIRRSLNTATFSDAYKQVKDSKNSAHFNKNLKSFDKHYRVPKYIKSQFPQLRKELESVLRECYDKIDLSNLAIKMDIEIDKKTNQKVLIKEIINKICLFVSLMLGKTKQNYGNAVLDKDVYFEVLQYTSYSYLTGKPGVDPFQWNELKKQARQAKIAIKERAKLQKKKNTFKNSKELLELTGGKGALSMRGLSNKLKKEDTGVLSDKSFEDLLALAGRYGIDPTKFKNKNISFLKAQIYTKLQYEARQFNNLSKKELNLVRRNIGGKKLQRIGDRQAAHDLGGFFDKNVVESSGIDVPIVAFDRKGNAISIPDRAIPVFIVGQGISGQGLNYTNNSLGSDFGGLLKVNKKIAKSMSITDLSMLSSQELKVYNYIMSLYFNKSNGIKNNIARSLCELRIDLGIPNTLSTQIYIDSGIDKDNISNTLSKIDEPDYESILNQIRLRFCYIYAVRHKLKSLEKYLMNKYNIRYKVRTTFKSKVKKVGKGLAMLPLQILNIGTLGIGKKIVNHVKNLIDMKNPTDRSQLPEKVKTIYDSLMKLNESELIKLILNKKGSPNNDIINKYISYTPNDNEERRLKEFFLRAVYAEIINERVLSNLFIHLGGLKGHPSLIGGKSMDKEVKMACKRGFFKSIGGGISRFFKGFKYAFRKRKTGIESVGSDEISDISNTNSTNTNLFLPKISYLGNGNVDEDIIREVLPVYVVNIKSLSNVENEKNLNNTNSPTEHTKYEEGIGKNLSLIEQYQQKYGLELTKGKNDIKITRKPSETLAEMLSKKDESGNSIYKLIKKEDAKNGDHSSSIFYDGKNHQINKFKKISNYDLKFALENDIKFATGGTTFSDAFITGDARGRNIFSGGAKPELVQTFSATPVLSRITPISKFAEGGTSLSKAVGGAVSAVNAVKKVALDNELTNKNKQGSSISSLNLKNTGNVKIDKQMDEIRKIQDDLQMRANISNAIEALGGDVPEDIQTAKPKKLAKILAKAVRNYLKEKRKRKKPSSSKSAAVLSGDAKKIGLKEVDTSLPTMPVYITNEFANGSDLFRYMSAINANITSNFSTLMTGLGSGFQLAAPMGVGMGIFTGLLGTGIANNVATVAGEAIAAGAQALADNFHTGGSIKKMATGGKAIPRFATGGQHSIITGDAAASNIFENGAKPELVSSNGDMTITPLNKTGTENQSKVTRMTPEERRNALATAISSHVIKFNYDIPDGMSEISNEGEAIKVYDVKPGIADKIDLNGSSTSLIEVLAVISTQLASILTTSTTGNQLLGAIASKPSNVTATTESAPTESNPFAGGFPNSLNSILGGN